MNNAYEMQVLVRPGPNSSMPPDAIGGAALCFVGAVDHEAAVRFVCAELNSRGYVCESLMGNFVGQIIPARWDERAHEICGQLASRFSDTEASIRAKLPDAAGIRTLTQEGGFHLGPIYCWDTKPQEDSDESPDDSGLSSEEVERHNELFSRGCKLVENLVYFDHRPYRQPDDSGRIKLREAIQCFDEVLAINPSHWQALLFMGKAFESLGEREQALAALLRAHECEPSQVAVAAEAGAAAGRLGRYDLSVRVLETVAEHHPNDPRLPCNLGITHLLMGDLENARRAFERACELEPQRDENRRLVELVNEVASGKRPCPRTEAEIGKALSGNRPSR